MPWLKRNLYLVIGGVGALALLGFAVYFLLAKIEKNRAVTEELDRQRSTLTTLANRNPHPNPSNIEAAKVEEQKLAVFLKEVQQNFPRTAVPTNLTSAEFRLLLDTTVNELQSKAKRSGVKIPNDYSFSFAGQRRTFSFPDVRMLGKQLLEVREIASILFDSKINELVAIKRVAVADEKKGTTVSGMISGMGMGMSTDDFLDEKQIVTNQWAVVAPYEVTFQGFTYELARVLEGFLNSPMAVVVKNIVVEKAVPGMGNPLETDSTLYDRYGVGAAPQLAPQAQMSDQARYGYGGRYGRGGGAAAMRSRYGAGPASRYGGGYSMDPDAVVTPTPNIGGNPAYSPIPYGPSGMGSSGENFLEEKPLRIILSVEVVQLKPEEATFQDQAPPAYQDPLYQSQTY